MFKLLAIFAASLVLAYISEHNTKAITASGHHYSVWNDWAYILLVVILTLFAGLRTAYNDTGNYIRIFNNLPGLQIFLSDPENLNPLGNPLFYFLANIIKDITGNSQVLIFTTSLFAQCCFIRFIKRYSESFLFGVFLYFTLGTFVLTLAAIKQITAMAVLTLAIPFLEKKKWPQYFVLVFVAMLIHTYAIAFVVLPLFTRKPWKLVTCAFALVMVVLLMNFQDVLTSFLEQADEMGKTIADYEVFDEHTVHILRIVVYALPPLISLIFRNWIFRNSSDMKNVLVHMSIISLAFMIMGTQSGANMFGRMANYFELGTVCTLPWMIKQVFDEKSYRLVSSAAVIGFLGYFAYATAVSTNFGQVYRAMSVFQFAASLIGF